MRRLIIGPPGTGKTTTLINIFKQYHGKKKILYLAFTRKAAMEARERISEALDVSVGELTNVRTIHSLCFRDLGLNRNNIMSKSHYRELGQEIGLDIGSVYMYEDYGIPQGDRVVFIENMARMKNISLEKAVEKYEDDISIMELKDYAWRYKRFKEVRGILDYTDLLHEHLACNPPSPDILIVDEGQDLSPLQWDIIENVGRNSSEIYVAGDDDQAIYLWAGADIDRFKGFTQDYSVLKQSYRLPQKVFEEARIIRDSMRSSLKKDFRPSKRVGTVDFLDSIDDLDLSSGEWYLLCRHQYQIRHYEELCLKWGVPFESGKSGPFSNGTIEAILLWESLMSGEKVDFDDVAKVYAMTSHVAHGYKTGARFPSDRGQLVGITELLNEFGLQVTGPWEKVLDRISPEEVDYVLQVRKRGENLSRKPRIRICTIHAVKGGEAENVAIMPDVSGKVMESIEKDYDEEARVFYVGLTRASRSLHILRPLTRNYFEI